MISDKRKTLIAVLNAMGFRHDDKLTISQISELERVMKDEYGIEVHIKEDDEWERLETAMHEHVLQSRPALEFCGPYLDGKAKRRERRKQERLKFKNKKL